MPGGRPSKPLFELLRDESTGRRSPPMRPSALARPQPVPEPELKPVPARPSLDPDQDPMPEPEHVAHTYDPAAHRPRLFGFNGETIQISRYTALVACAVVLGVAFTIYLVAYSAGQRKGNKDFIERRVPPDSPPPTVIQPRPIETLGQRPSVPEPALKAAGPSKGKTPVDGSKPASPNAPRAFDDPTKPVLTATGAYDADPRTPSLNYLVLATRLTREDARKLVAFLTVNGLEVVGVPAKVESGGVQANNPGSYKVVTLTGITRDQYRSDDPLKARLKAEGTRLGELWKDQFKTTFIKDTYWEVLTP